MRTIDLNVTRFAPLNIFTYTYSIIINLFVVGRINLAGRSLVVTGLAYNHYIIIVSSCDGWLLFIGLFNYLISNITYAIFVIS